MGERAADGSPGGHRLARSSSAYLRAAKDQPIAWYPWGEEAFALARASGRPVLLDIGASWCHWCHVMDEGTYSDPEVGRLLAESYVAVKVDRDEHPEIDRRYQLQVGLVSGEGGWPLTAFLTPEGEVFFGGTYFAPTAQHGRPGLREILEQLARRWRETPQELRHHADHVRDGLARLAARAPEPTPVGAFVERVVEQIHQSFDPVHGGFGLEPKFPHPTAVALLLWDDARGGRPTSGTYAKETLERMADGGLYDQIGGGFHRYATDEAWHIPHFEKMAADNAALLAAYVEGAQRFGFDRFGAILGGTIDWFRRTLADPAGGFGASQDADNAPGDDGSYYTWSRAGISAALAEEDAKLVSRVFGVGTEGRMPHDPQQNVLFRAATVEEVAHAMGLPLEHAQRRFSLATEQLRGLRAKRPAPGVDRALYADLNGAIAIGFARAASALLDRGLLADAERTVDRFLRDAYRPGIGVAHRLDPDGTPHGFGLLADQAEFARALVEVAGAAVRPDLAERAGELLSLIDREFRGEDRLLRDVAPALYDGPRLAGVERPSYPLEDSPHLAANAAFALALARLGALVHDESWSEKARGLAPPLAARLGRAGLFGAGAALASGLSTTPAVTVVIEDGDGADALERVARGTYHPNAWVFRGTPPRPFSLADAPSPGENGRAIVCVGASCRPPISSAEALVAAMRAAPPEG